MKNVLYLSALILLFTASPAQAYIDPGSGSAIMSVVIGFFVAVGIVVKTFWYKITGFFRPSKTKLASEQTETPSKEK